MKKNKKTDLIEDIADVLYKHKPNLYKYLIERGVTSEIADGAQELICDWVANVTAEFTDEI